LRLLDFASALQLVIFSCCGVAARTVLLPNTIASDNIPSINADRVMVVLLQWGCGNIKRAAFL
jgi:hypothetical protein